MQSVYYKNLGINRSMYDAALNCFENRGGSFRVMSSMPAAVLAVGVLNDHPDIFYVGQEFRIRSSLVWREVTPVYLYSPAETTRIRDKLEAEAQKIIYEHISDYQSEYDMVCSLHDYLKSNLEYDKAAAAMPLSNERNIAEAHSIVGALLKNKCVCEGFAKAFKYLCNKVGLECWVVSGVGRNSLGTGSHAWNIVKINGYYHHVDVTWDKQSSGALTMPNYGYMNLSDDEIAIDHIWNRQNYPECPNAPYNYFKVNNALVDNKTQLEHLLYNSFQAEEEYVMFKVVRGSVLEREIKGCFEESIQRASDRCKRVSVSSYRYSEVPAQLTFFIRPDYYNI